jgi:hypothetical protein
MKDETHYDHLVRLLTTARTDASRYFLVPRYESMKAIIDAMPNDIPFGIRVQAVCALEIGSSTDPDQCIGQIRWSEASPKRAASWRCYSNSVNGKRIPATDTGAIVKFLAAVSATCGTPDPSAQIYSIEHYRRLGGHVPSF